MAHVSNFLVRVFPGHRIGAAVLVGAGLVAAILARGTAAPNDLFLMVLMASATVFGLAAVQSPRSASAMARSPAASKNRDFITRSQVFRGRV